MPRAAVMLIFRHAAPHCPDADAMPPLIRRALFIMFFHTLYYDADAAR